MHLVKIGKYTINLENVTEVIDEGDRIAVCFLAAWQTGEDTTGIASRNLYGEEAEAMRSYIARHTENAMAQLR